jgi:hypothetical protein
VSKGGGRECTRHVDADVDVCEERRLGVPSMHTHRSNARCGFNSRWRAREVEKGRGGEGEKRRAGGRGGQSNAWESEPEVVSRGGQHVPGKGEWERRWESVEGVEGVEVRSRKPVRERLR